MNKHRNFEIAPDDNIQKYKEFADKFLLDVFELEEGALLTDESSLYDFDMEIDVADKKVIHHTEEYLKKIEYLYGVDVSNVEGLILYKVVEKILNEKEKK